MGLFKFLVKILSNFELSKYEYYSDENYSRWSKNTDDNSDYYSNYHYSQLDEYSDDYSEINPATGLPMIGEVDVAGNPYGTSDDDYSFDNNWCDDSWNNFSSFDDSFNNDY